VIKYMGTKALVGSFFCMIANASDLAIVKTWNGALLIPAQWFLGICNSRYQCVCM
jgi:hypothetical protein